MASMSLEKLLKGYFVSVKRKHPPYTHDLTRLAVETGLQLSQEQITLLDTVTQFNIEARYPDVKLSFHKKATKEYSKDYIRNIKEFYRWLNSKIPV
jgi:HEPN domain-containing protein